MSTETKIKIGAIASGAIISVILVLLLMSVTVIKQGEAGVVYNRSHGIKDEVLHQGWRLVWPNEKVTKYPVSTETVKVDAFNVQTKDGKPLKVTLSYDYMNDIEMLPHIYNKFKGQKPSVIEDGWLQTRIKKATLGVFSKYSVLEVFQNQGKINGEIEDLFKETVKEHGFIIDSVTLGAPAPDKETAKAIQAVVDASQELEKLEIEKKQEKARSDKKIEKARGDSESEVIRAKGKAEANEIIRKSLSKEIVEYKSIEKWDGKLSIVSGSSGSMIQLPNDIIEKKR